MNRELMFSNVNNAWCTPQDYFDELNAEFNFTLDPCATQENHKCNIFYTINDDGLNKDWNKNRVFMNPPYGGHTGKWIKKAWEESQKGCIVVCLIVSSTDRSYWHDYIFPFASQIRFIRGRISFGTSKSTAPFASAIIIFGKQFKDKIIFYKESINSKRKEIEGKK